MSSQGGSRQTSPEMMKLDLVEISSRCKSDPSSVNKQDQSMSTEVRPV